MLPIYEASKVATVSSLGDSLHTLCAHNFSLNEDNLEILFAFANLHLQH